jgi:hypothetical protein
MIAAILDCIFGSPMRRGAFYAMTVRQRLQVYGLIEP